MLSATGFLSVIWELRFLIGKEKVAVSDPPATLALIKCVRVCMYIFMIGHL